MKPRLTILALTGVLVAGTAAGADRPPQPLHLVGDHWTAWDPPASQEPGVEVYTIVRGDTLWDLAAHHLGDPYLWPQIWEHNRYILDAHWIYPGDPLVLGLQVTNPEIPPEGPLAEVVPPASPASPEAAPEAEKLPYQSAAAGAGQPGPLGTESDIYCSGFIGDLDEDLPYEVIGSEYQALSPTVSTRRNGGHSSLYGTDTLKVGLTGGDIVYLGEGRGAGLAPGKVLTAVLPEEKVRHPISKQVVGRFYRYLGRVRVLSVQPTTAIGEIIHTCDPLVVGSRLVDFEEEPVPLGRRTGMRPVNLPPPAEALADAPVILRAKDNVVTLGEDNVVYIDRGEDSEVVPGDIYTIYRLHRTDLPPVILGELAIVAVHRHSAVARITSSRYTIYVGDRLELK